MVALKKSNENPSDDTLEAPLSTQDNKQVDYNNELEQLKNSFTNDLDAAQRDAFCLLTIALVFADDPHADETHAYLKPLSIICGKPINIFYIRKISSAYQKNPMNVVDLFKHPAQQSVLLKACHTLIHCKEFQPEHEKTFNYQNIQNKLGAEAIFNDILAFYINWALNQAKIENRVPLPKPEDLLKILLDEKPVSIQCQDPAKIRYLGHWKTILERSEKHIQDLQNKADQAKSHGKFPLGLIRRQTASYTPFTLVKNRILDKIDQDIGFPCMISEDDAYTLLGVIGHASSADGAQNDAMEAQFLKDLVVRLRFPLNRETFSEKISLPLSQLLSQAHSPELQHAIYYETLCMMTANLEISQEEKAMLNVLSLTFKLSYKKTLLLHTRHYLDSGLRGLEDSLRFMPAQLNTAHHSLHRFQDALSELGIVPLTQIVASGKAYLESMEPMKLPKDAPTEIKVAALSLVGNAMRLDNIFDEAEKAFLQKTMLELGLKGEDLKAHTHIMKESSVADLCAILKIWAMAKNNTVSLSAVGYFVLRAISADGVIDEKEDKFKTLFFKELGLDPAQYLRILLRAQLDLVE